MIQNKKLIAKVTLKDYIREVQLSKAQRPKYYEWNGTTIKCGSKKLLQKYINPIYKKNIILNNGNIKIQYLKEKYCIVGYKGKYIASVIKQDEIEQNFALTEAQHKKPIKYFLCETVEDGNSYSILYPKVIANEAQAGKPKMYIIKGQDFYVGLNPFVRNKVVHKLKESYFKKFSTISKEALSKFRDNLNNNYPLIIEMEIQDTVKSCFDNTKKGNGRRWDVGNRAHPYMKTFLDFLTKGYSKYDKQGNEIPILESFIIDDDRLHISSGDNAYFTPIEEYETPTLVFYIYKDMRKVFIPYLKQEK